MWKIASAALGIAAAAMVVVDAAAVTDHQPMMIAAEAAEAAD